MSRVRRIAAKPPAIEWEMDAQRPLPRSWFGVLADAGRKWAADDCMRMAAALSFYTAFSAAPLVLLTVAVLAVLVGADAADGVVSDRVAASLGPERAALVGRLASGAARPESGGLAGAVGFFTMLWGASAVAGELRAGLNRVFSAPAAPGLLWSRVRHRLVAFGFVLGAGFVMLVSLVLGAFAAAAGKFFGGALGLGEGALHAFNQASSLLVGTLLFSAMYRILPDVRASWRDCAAGGLLTSVLFALGSLALGLYLGKLGPASAYGAAGALMAFLLWTYYCAQILYFGAEFTHAFARGRGEGLEARRGWGRAP